MTQPRDGAPHVPVLLDRVVALFADAPDGVYVDGTLGAAGHAAAVLQARADRYGHATLVGLDRDPHALALARAHLAEVGGAVEVHLVRTRFDGIAEVLDDLGIDRVAGVFLDLGISSMHVDEAERGFSYRQDGPLDMRMDPDLPRTAADLVNDLDARELARILRRYGDERFADRIARAVVAARPLSRTVELAEVVRNAIPAAARRTGGHPATRTFQALRIAVNGELDALEQILPVALDRLAVGGVFAVLSYHSLEDRAVKRAFADAATGCVCPPGLPVCACGRTPQVEHLIRRPERPSPDEAAANPRATAARLRVVRRLES
ncbi:16S rRNA (cytosine(1402)-N(4))-methyltransferase RsmH [Egicoccus sp. AB-alg2]|uniref:16S rRNA (cytosine(1402)-N(4))-methyltransferase RsmH n=1 Tax=Egicoccus sp. AB-alg2 TaxID=3242693 RepID=UPI00359E361C